jgi:hypothetical protein
VFGIAAIVLIVSLGGFLWRNSGKTDRFPENADTPLSTLYSEPLHDTDPAPTLSTPASPEEDTDMPPALALELLPIPETEPGSEPELMSIPSLPANQQQGRHNRHDLPGIEDDAPSTPASAPVPNAGARRFEDVE